MFRFLALSGDGDITSAYFKAETVVFLGEEIDSELFCSVQVVS